jgi:hypothetical protein
MKLQHEVVKENSIWGMQITSPELWTSVGSETISMISAKVVSTYIYYYSVINSFSMIYVS